MADLALVYNSKIFHAIFLFSDNAAGKNLHDDDDHDHVGINFSRLQLALKIVIRPLHILMQTVNVLSR